MGVSANSIGLSGMVTNLTTGISGFATSALSAIGQIVPVALPIAGAGIIIGVAIKTMKKLST